MLIPKYGKTCWGNGEYILKKMGYLRNKKALPKLAGLLPDRNGSGALEAIELFGRLGKEISIPYIGKNVENQFDVTMWIGLNIFIFQLSALVWRKKISTTH